jgi:putative FmdB family regulatory protein
MPLVDYKCPQCGTEQKDVLVKTTTAPHDCPECHYPMEKLPPNSNWAFSRKDRRWDR